MKKIIPIISIAFILSSCNHQQATPKVVQSVTMTQVQKQALNSTESYDFIAQPYQTAQLSFRISGQIDQLDIHAGDYFTTNQTIAQLDTRDFIINEQRHEALYKQAFADYKRMDTLYKQDNISASTYEAAHAKYLLSKSNFEDAQNKVVDTHLRAPFNGYIGSVYVDNYQYIRPTQAIVSLVETDRLLIETYVTEEIAQQNIDSVALSFNKTPQKSIKIPVLNISKSTTSNNVSYKLTAVLNNTAQSYLAGMSGKVHIDQNNNAASVLSLPQSTICHHSQIGDFVWKIQGHSIVQQKITLGSFLNNNTVAIIDGLNLNDSIATSGFKFLTNGQTIQIKK